MCLSLNFFLNFLRKKNVFFNFILCQKCFHHLQCFFFKKWPQMLPNKAKSQFLLHKNVPPRDFSIMTLSVPMAEGPRAYALQINTTRLRWNSSHSSYYVLRSYYDEWLEFHCNLVVYICSVLNFQIL